MDPAVRQFPDGYDRAGCVLSDLQGSNLLKKLEEAEGPEKENSADIDTDTLVLAGIERGLTITDIKRMQIGQLVDFCISFNRRQEDMEKAAKREEKRGRKRKAKQDDINAFFG